MRILNCITDFNHYFSAQTLHPQVAVAELFRADFSLFDTKVYDMYALIMIDGVFGELIRDGKPLPYTKGSLVTIRPGQSIEMKMDYTTKPQGWMLAFKPELLEKTGKDNLDSAFIQLLPEEILHKYFQLPK